MIIDTPLILILMMMMVMVVMMVMMMVVLGLILFVAIMTTSDLRKLTLAQFLQYGFFLRHFFREQRHGSLLFLKAKVLRVVITFQ